MSDADLPVADAATDTGADTASDALLRTGALTDEQAQIVAGHQAATGLGFDQAAVALELATDADIADARQMVEGSRALALAPSDTASEELVVVSDPTSPAAEALRLLRTQVIAQHIGMGRRAFAVVGATEGVGVTYIAANLAVALAQVGIKVLLADANLRNPRLDRVFGIDPNGPGLSTYLTLAVNRPERIVYGNVMANLSVVTAGPPVPRPQELLSSARFRAGVDILLRQYDVAIFDTPPSNESADALTVAGTLGYGLIVARRNHSYVADIQVLANQLTAARATAIGSVLNVHGRD